MTTTKTSPQTETDIVADVLATHDTHHYTWDYRESGVNLALCICGHKEVGTQEPHELAAAHQARAVMDVLYAARYRKIESGA